MKLCIRRTSHSMKSRFDEKALQWKGTPPFLVPSWNVGFCWAFAAFIVKNLLGIQDILFPMSVVYLQVLLTGLTPVDKTQLFLKPSNFSKNRLVTFCLWDKESNFHAWEMRESVDDLDSFCHYQLTVVTNLLLLIAGTYIWTFLTLGTETYCRWVNHYQYHSLFKTF